MNEHRALVRVFVLATDRAFFFESFLSRLSHCGEGVSVRNHIYERDANDRSANPGHGPATWDTEVLEA